jgi:hypothetical protein
MRRERKQVVLQLDAIQFDVRHKLALRSFFGRWRGYQPLLDSHRDNAICRASLGAITSAIAETLMASCSNPVGAGPPRRPQPVRSPPCRN